MPQDETVVGRLRRIVETNTSTTEDDALVQGILRRFGFPAAVVTYGVVYANGAGRPLSIQQAAEQILSAFDARAEE